MAFLDNKKLRLLSAAVLLTMLPLPADAGLEENYPAGSLVYAHWAGRSIIFDGSDFGRMMLEQKTGDHLLKMVTAAGTTSPSEKELVAHLGGMWSIAWQHPCSLGLTGITDGGIPRVIFTAYLDKDAPAFGKKLDRVTEMLSRENDGIAPATKSGRGSYRLLPLDDERIEASMGFAGSIFFMVLGEKGFTARFLGAKPKKSVADDKQYRERIKTVAGKNTQSMMYVDFSGIARRLEEIERGGKTAKTPADTPSTTRTVLESLGLEKVAFLAAATRIENKLMHTRYAIAAPPPHRGLLLPLAGSPLSGPDIAVVPADASFFIACNISLQNMREEIHRGLKRMSPDAAADFAAAEAAFGKELKLSLEKDILPVLGDTLVMSSAGSHGGFPSGTILSLELADAKKAAAVVAGLEKLIPAPAAIRKMKSGKTEIHYLVAGESDVPVLPAWAIHNNRLLLALWPQVLAGAIEARTPPLASQKHFATLRSQVSKNSSILVYLDTPRIVRALYPLQLVASSFLANAIDPKTPQAQWFLPLGNSLQETLRFLRPGITAVSSDKTGITIDCIGPGPGGIVFAGGIAAAATYVSYRADAARERDLMAEEARAKAAAEARRRKRESAEKETKPPKAGEQPPAR